MHHQATDGVRRPGTARLVLGAALTTLALVAPAGAQAGTYAQTILQTPSLDHYWRLGETGGVKAYDAEGRADGIFGAQVELGRPGALATDRDRAAGFSGAIPDRVWESHVKTGAVPDVWGTASFSLEAWVKPGVLDGHSRRIFSIEDDRGGVLLAARASGVSLSRHLRAGRHYTPDAGWSAAAVPAQAQTARAPIAAGEWSHVVGTYDGAVLRVYVNGRLEASESSTLYLNTYSDMSIGAETRGWLEWDGDLDELAVYRGALDPQDVAEHHAAGVGVGEDDTETEDEDDDDDDKAGHGHGKGHGKGRGHDHHGKGRGRGHDHHDDDDEDDEDGDDEDDEDDEDDD
jgi:hypothetical protein